MMLARSCGVAFRRLRCGVIDVSSVLTPLSQVSSTVLLLTVVCDVMSRVRKLCMQGTWRLGGDVSCLQCLHVMNLAPSFERSTRAR